MLTIDLFDYPLSKEFIAQVPAQPRDHSKLLVVNRETGALEHHHFYDLPDLLTENDVIVRNNTKVIPARIFGRKISPQVDRKKQPQQLHQNTPHQLHLQQSHPDVTTKSTIGGHVELLLVKRTRLETHQEVWECLTKPGLKPGQTVIFEDSSLTATCTAITGYTREIQFNLSHSALFEELVRIGHTPVPPYITYWSDEDEPKLRQLYQTTFAKVQGSAAAPTAGLHFTPEIDERLTTKGVQIEEITLHVGLGTFLSVKTNDITQHDMHREWFTLPEDVATRLSKAKQNRKRIIAVGTTSTRVLETCAVAREKNNNDHSTGSGNRRENAVEIDTTGQLIPQTGETQLYVYPPHRFKFVDAMITNFHEPKTTLIMLVSAFCSAPNTSHPFETFTYTTVGNAYLEAMKHNYRFLSFGDGMLITE